MDELALVLGRCQGDDLVLAWRLLLGSPRAKAKEPRSTARIPERTGKVRLQNLHFNPSTLACVYTAEGGKWLFIRRHSRIFLSSSGVSVYNFVRHI